MLDCACLASIVAFKHFRRPEVEVIGEEVIVVRESHFVWWRRSSELVSPLLS